MIRRVGVWVIGHLDLWVWKLRRKWEEAGEKKDDNDGA